MSQVRTLLGALRLGLLLEDLAQCKHFDKHFLKIGLYCSHVFPQQSKQITQLALGASRRVAQAGYAIAQS